MNDNMIFLCRRQILNVESKFDSSVSCYELSPKKNISLKSTGIQDGYIADRAFVQIEDRIIRTVFDFMAAAGVKHLCLYSYYPFNEDMNIGESRPECGNPPRRLRECELKGILKQGLECKAYLLAANVRSTFCIRLQTGLRLGVYAKISESEAEEIASKNGLKVRRWVRPEYKEEHLSEEVTSDTDSGTITIVKYTHQDDE